jgi:CheY-like chemotaxis protein
LAAAPRAAPRRPRVLVVDDEPEIGFILEHALRAECDVTAVSSGKAALEQIRKNPEWDVVFCDLMMPGVSGVDVYDRATRASPAIADRFVFMTGGAFTGRARELLERVPNARIDKPFDLRKVQRLVRELVQAASIVVPDSGRSGESGESE